MEGHGVTNYATDKPTFALTPSTTEFDDALLHRNIVTHSQVMLAKGASSTEEANRLTELLLASKKTKKNPTVETPSQDDSNNSDDDDSFDDDDEVLQRYRMQRTAQIKQQQSSSSLQYIQKSDWPRCVNDASHQQWVVVCLTSSDTERTGCMERAVQELSKTCIPHVQFVLIPYQQAIDERWPLQNLPCLFLYRHGVMQKQLLGLAHNHTKESLYDLLQSHIEELES